MRKKAGVSETRFWDTTCLYYRFLAHIFFLLRSSEDKVRTVFIILLAEFSVEIYSDYQHIACEIPHSTPVNLE